MIKRKNFTKQQKKSSYFHFNSLPQKLVLFIYFERLVYFLNVSPRLVIFIKLHDFSISIAF